MSKCFIAWLTFTARPEWYVRLPVNNHTLFFTSPGKSSHPYTQRCKVSGIRTGAHVFLTVLTESLALKDFVTFSKYRGLSDKLTLGLSGICIGVNDLTWLKATANTVIVTTVLDLPWFSKHRAWNAIHAHLGLEIVTLVTIIVSTQTFQLVINTKRFLSCGPFRILLS